MNERQPYEEQLALQWDALPLPDEHAAWADMRRRLDEDENRKPIAWWRWPGCLLTALLLAGLLTGGWLLLKPEKWFTKNKEANTTKSTIAPTQQETLSNTNTTTHEETISRKQTIDTAVSSWEKNESSYQSKTIKQADTGQTVQETSPVANATGKKGTTSVGVKQKTGSPANAVIKTGAVNKTKKANTSTAKKPGDKKNTQSIDNGNKPVIPDTVATAAKPGPIKDSTVVIAVKPVDKKDIDGKKATDSKPTDSIKTADAKKDEEKKKKQKTPFLVSAGLGLHQQLPVSGQKFTPYNSLGRKSSLADYIPSVYMRLEKEKKWFLQSEFRYGAPQSTKQFDFRQQIVPDTGSNPRYTTTTTYNLRKTFYHQLPLTFNYYIRPGWSIGTGLQWNSLYAAVAEKTISRRDNLFQQDTILGKPVEAFKRDSAVEFSKNYVQLVVESQYQWRRLSVGARYTAGLQPYIRFSLPGQSPAEERNHSLQIFLRYELWKQKKK